MINRARITCLCASMIFLSQTISGITSEVILTTAEEVQDYLYETIDKIQASVDMITQIPLDQRTFENTLQAWNLLAGKLEDTTNTLTSIENPAVMQDWYSFINSAVFQNTELSKAIMLYAYNPPDMEILNPYAQNALKHFITPSSQDTPYVHLAGLAEDKESNGENLTLFNLNANSDEKLSLEGLIEKILHANADVVCIQEIIGIDSSYAFYDALKEQYAHFYTTIDMHGFSSDTPIAAKGMLIASKYPIGNPQYTPFSNNRDSGFIDFTLKSENTLLGRVFIAQLKPNQAQVMPLEQILSVMESEYQKDIPFLLCSNMEVTDESHELVEAYFVYDSTELSNKKTLLLRPGSSRHSDHQIETSSVSISDNHQALLSSIKQPKFVSPDDSSSLSIHKPARMSQSSKSYIILCEANEGNDNNQNPTEQRQEREYERERNRNEPGRLELNLGSKNDHQGNESFNGGVGYKSPNGWEASVDGEFGKDSQGNTSHKVQGKISIPIGRN